MIRRLALLVCGASALIATAQPGPAGMSLTSDRSEYNQATDESTFTGKAELREADLLVTADQLRYKGSANVNPDTIIATGHVVYTRGPLRVLADQVVVHRQDRTFSAEHIRLGQYPYYIEGTSATGTRDEITVYNARVTYGEPGPWAPTATAAKIVISPGHRIAWDQAQVGIGHARPIPFPKFQQTLSGTLLSGLSLTGGYRASLGAYADAGMHLPVAPGIRLGGDVGYYTARGLLLGPSGTYSDPDDPDRLTGSFTSGYIDDHGNKGTDILGRPIGENRGFLEWRHHEQITDNLTLSGQFNWWKDSDVMRDFHPRDFFPVQKPDSFVEATYAAPNWFVSAFSRFDPNSFEIVQQRLPELRFDLMPISVGGGIYERLNASIALLRENPVPGITTAPGFLTSPLDDPLYPIALGSPNSTFPSGGTVRDLRSTRLDAYYQLSRPIAPRDWFAITPVVGGRVTHYMDTQGAAQDGTYTRVLGEVGFDAEMHASGTFAYQNETWHINGLRHLFTPRISYRYIPEADKGQAYIPPIDRQAFSTYLQPLGLGDGRNIDQLQATNTLRLEFENTLQTRDPQYGTRDLLRFDVANDFRFKRQPGEKDVSEIHTSLSASPVGWLELGLYSSFAPQTSTMREFNSGITFRDGDLWTVQFGNNFLRHNLQDYLINARRRLNEEFQAIMLLQYDQRAHRFNEQSYGIVQNLGNTWRISYLVNVYSGRRRDNGFGMSVQVDTIRF
ncbi:MAG TPA: LPS assembly protein LptD [Opitutaceae bacterium]|nr:LPS assembly protein LptD [Opitutaceae bacterium]